MHLALINGGVKQVALMKQIKQTRIILRNDSVANWIANNSAVLLRGEVGIEFPETGAPRIKIGDGASAWADLPYFGITPDSSITAINKNVFAIDGDSNLTMLGFEEAEPGMSPIKSSNGQLIWTKLDVAELDSKIESLAEVVNQKVDLIYSEVDGEQVPWTLLSPENSRKLDSIAYGAQENVIENICLANSGKCLAVVNKTVQLPLATSTIPGLVKLSKEISIDENQALAIREVNVNKLVQNANEELHLICGTSL